MAGVPHRQHLRPALPQPAPQRPDQPARLGPRAQRAGPGAGAAAARTPPAQPGRVAALKLNGAYVTGTLELSGGAIAPYVELRNCRFEQEILLPESRFTTLRLVGCAIPRIEAARLHTEGDLHLPRCTVDRGIRLTDAQIGTDLLLNQLVVRKDRFSRSITAYGLSVAQDFQAELIES